MNQYIDLTLYKSAYGNSYFPDTLYTGTPFWGWTYNTNYQTWIRTHAWFELQDLLPINNIQEHQIINAELNVTTTSNLSIAIDSSVHIVKYQYAVMDYITWNHAHSPYTLWSVPGGIGMNTDIYSTPLETRKFIDKVNVIPVTAAEVITLRNTMKLLFYTPNQPPDQSMRIHYVSNIFLRVYYNPGLTGDITIF